MSTRLVASLMLVASGMFTGVLCALSIERVWIWQRLELRDYAVDFRRSVRRVDIIQPALLLITIAMASVYAARTANSSRTETFVALACLVAILAGSVLLLVPLQKQFRDRPEGEVPPGAATIRRRWRIGHLVRTGLGLVAFAFLVHAAVRA